MRELFFVFLGGGLGSLFRFLVSKFLDNKELISNFPIGTFFVNILGSFLLGIVIMYLASNSVHWLRYLFVIGFCGGFTTFSTFSYDALQLLKNENYFNFFVYIFLSFALCITMVYLGTKVASYCARV